MAKPEDVVITITEIKELVAAHYQQQTGCPVEQVRVGFLDLPGEGTRFRAIIEFKNETPDQEL